MPIQINFEALIIVRKANFITWYKDGSPDITNENLRDVTRMADARGKQFFEDFDVPPVDLTSAGEKMSKKKSILISFLSSLMCRSWGIRLKRGRNEVFEC
jgi:hypothetical protein